MKILSTSRALHQTLIFPAALQKEKKREYLSVAHGPAQTPMRPVARRSAFRQTGLWKEMSVDAVVWSAPFHVRIALAIHEDEEKRELRSCFSSSSSSTSPVVDCFDVETVRREC